VFTADVSIGGEDRGGGGAVLLLLEGARERLVRVHR
jgi:hypothetical protein